MFSPVSSSVTKESLTILTDSIVSESKASTSSFVEGDSSIKYKESLISSSITSGSGRSTFGNSISLASFQCFFWMIVPFSSFKIPGLERTMVFKAVSSQK